LLWVTSLPFLPSSLRQAHRVRNVIPIEDIAEVTPHVDEDSVTVIHGKNLSKFQLATKDGSDFENTVMSQAELRRSELEKAKEAGRVQVVLDFTFLRDFMEKGGLVIQKIACTSCGAPMLLPESGNSVSCQYCRATFHFEDIFERIKQLMEIASKKNL
jgi:hypothetical protein